MTNVSNHQKHSVFTGLFLICICLLLLSFFTSCTVTRPNSYFRDIIKDTVLTVAPKLGQELKIRAGDILVITFSSLNPDEDKLYNANVNSKYEVSKEGNIHLHRLGKLPVEGLTRKQLKQKIEDDMLPYLKDPVVTINFANHNITVIGAIGKSQVLPMPEERISIIDALAQGGSLAESILLTDVVIIRDSGSTQKQIKHLNLESNSVFASDYFYLQPNDVVVLKPDEKTILEEKKRLKFQQVSSIVLQAVTLGLVIYQAFFRN